MTVRKNGADAGTLKTRMDVLIRGIGTHHGMGDFLGRFLIISCPTLPCRPRLFAGTTVEYVSRTVRKSLDSNFKQPSARIPAPPRELGF
jgi:hypothetical protein